MRCKQAVHRRNPVIPVSGHRSTTGTTSLLEPLLTQHPIALLHPTPRTLTSPRLVLEANNSSLLAQIMPEGSDSSFTTTSDNTGTSGNWKLKGGSHSGSTVFHRGGPGSLSWGRLP